HSPAGARAVPPAGRGTTGGRTASGRATPSAGPVAELRVARSLRARTGRTRSASDRLRSGFDPLPVRDRTRAALGASGLGAPRVGALLGGARAGHEGDERA